MFQLIYKSYCKNENLINSNYSRNIWQYFWQTIKFNCVLIWYKKKSLFWGPSWSWSYSSWIYSYLCNHSLSTLMLWVRILFVARYTTLCDKVCQWYATGRWFSPNTPVSSTNKTDRRDITEILLKVALNTINHLNLRKSLKLHWLEIY